jgi:N utilization substance protein B
VAPDPFAVELVEGVGARLAELDALIDEHARGWSVERMPRLDLAVLRIGAFELAHRPDVPLAVAIDEAVGLASTYSTDDSGRFVNGVLSAIGRAVR